MRRMCRATVVAALGLPLLFAAPATAMASDVPDINIDIHPNIDTVVIVGDANAVYEPMVHTGD